MDPEQFCALVDELKQSRDKMKELKCKVSAVHERTTWELAQKITKSSYQFKKKAREIQFTFNSGVEESINTTKKELSKIAAIDEQDKEAVKKADMFLDEGLKALYKCQKHNKVAYCSDFRWAMVEYYDSHLLAANSDDEKRLENAKKEVERAANKHRRAVALLVPKRRVYPVAPDLA